MQARRRGGPARRTSRSAAASSASCAARRGRVTRVIPVGRGRRSSGALGSSRAPSCRVRRARRTSRDCSPDARARCSGPRCASLVHARTCCSSTRPAEIIRAGPAWRSSSGPSSTSRRWASRIACSLPRATGRRTNEAQWLPSTSATSALATGSVRAEARVPWPCMRLGGSMRRRPSRLSQHWPGERERRSRSGRRGAWRARRVPRCRVVAEEVAE